VLRRLTQGEGPTEQVQRRGQRSHQDGRQLDAPPAPRPQDRRYLLLRLRLLPTFSTCCCCRRRRRRHLASGTCARSACAAPAESCRASWGTTCRTPQPLAARLWGECACGPRRPRLCACSRYGGAPSTLRASSLSVFLPVSLFVRRVLTSRHRARWCRPRHHGGWRRVRCRWRIGGRERA